MKNTIYIILIIIILVSCSKKTTYDLSKDLNNIACSSINEVNKSGIIVRLTTYRNTLNAYKSRYDKFQNQEDLDRYNEIIAKKELEQREIIAAFKDNYIFSEVYFLPDSNFISFKKGVRKEIFLDDSLKIDKNIEFKGSRPLFMINNGNDPSYAVVDISLNKLIEPFPAENIQVRPGNVFNRLTDEIFFDTGILRRDIKTFNDKFWAFHKKCQNSADE